MKTVKKVCAVCRRTKAATWVCRGCGAFCCRHLCGFKVELTHVGLASCGKCQRGFMRPGAVEA